MDTDASAKNGIAASNPAVKTNLVFSIRFIFFKAVTKLMLRVGLADIRVVVKPSITIGTVSPVDLVVVNHVNAWDGLVIYHVIQKIWKKKVYFPTEAQELSQRSWLREFGCRPLVRGKGGGIQSLGKILDERNQSSGAIVFFPQGRHQPQDPPYATFAKGLEYLCSQSKCLVVGYCYFFWTSRFRPSVILYFDLKRMNTSVEDQWTEVFTELRVIHQRDYRQVSQLGTSFWDWK